MGVGKSKTHSITNLWLAYGDNGLQANCYVCGFRRKYDMGMRLSEIKRDHAQWTRQNGSSKQ